jgi:hypothetical protein
MTTVSYETISFVRATLSYRNMSELVFEWAEKPGFPRSSTTFY